MTHANVVLIVGFVVPFIFGVIACVSDIRERRIPNWISVVLVLTGMVFNLWVFGGSGALRSVYGLLCGSSLLLIMYLIGGGGAGDVKFMGGVGAWIGPYHMFFVYVLSALVIAIWAVTTFLFRMMLSGNVKQKKIAGQVEANFRTRTAVPYAVPATTSILLRLLWLVLINRPL